MTSVITGIKNIQILATTRYPVVSAYEYEFLKGEQVVRDRMSGCTIYFILQRPLTYFNDVTMSEGSIYLDIVDGVHPPLHCKVDLEECELMHPSETLQVELQYYKKQADLQEPYNDVAAFKILREDGQFVVWETPQKLLYEAIANGLPVRFDGNVNDYLDYHVHYIGKAFSQRVWRRLTGHEKMQKILTMQGPLAGGNASAPFEISLLMLQIVGFDEANLSGSYDFAVPKGISPIVHDVSTEDAWVRFHKPALLPDSPELTSEVEAMLVKTFKPKYNDVLFDNYPNINKGTRSAGYTHATLLIDKLPIMLRTAHHSHPDLFGPVELDPGEPDNASPNQQD